MRLLLSTIACLAGASLVGAAAQTQCFCLTHPATTDIVRYGCEARTIPNRVSERVTCQTQDLQSREAVTNQADFGRITAGEGACNPCFAIACAPGEDCDEDMIRLPASRPVEGSGDGG